MKTPTQLVLQARNQIVKDYHESGGLFEPNLDRVILAAIEKATEWKDEQLTAERKANVKAWLIIKQLRAAQASEE